MVFNTLVTHKNFQRRHTAYLFLRMGIILHFPNIQICLQIQPEIYGSIASSIINAGAILPPAAAGLEHTNSVRQKWPAARFAC